MNSKTRGILCIILAAICFAFMNLFVKLAVGIPFVEKAFFRNFPAMFFSGLVLIKSKTSLIPPKESRKYIFYRCFFGSLGVFCNFYAIGKLVISDASMLNKLSPFFAILFSFILIKEKIKPYQFICIVIAFIGAVCILKPGVDMLTTFPAFVGMISGMMAGLAYTNVRIASKYGAPGPVIVFFFSLFTCLFSIPLMIPVFVMPSLKNLIILLMAGLSATGGQFAITAAYSHAPASEISVYDYFQVVFAALLGMIFLGEMPDYLSIIGYILICSASVVMFLLRKRFDKEPVKEET